MLNQPGLERFQLQPMLFDERRQIELDFVKKMRGRQNAVEVEHDIRHFVLRVQCGHLVHIKGNELKFDLREPFLQPLREIGVDLSHRRER